MGPNSTEKRMKLLDSIIQAYQAKKLMLQAQELRKQSHITRAPK